MCLWCMNILNEIHFKNSTMKYFAHGTWHLDHKHETWIFLIFLKIQRNDSNNEKSLHLTQNIWITFHILQSTFKQNINLWQKLCVVKAVNTHISKWKYVTWHERLDWIQSFASIVFQSNPKKFITCVPGLWKTNIVSNELLLHPSSDTTDPLTLTTRYKNTKLYNFSLSYGIWKWKIIIIRSVSLSCMNADEIV